MDGYSVLPMTGNGSALSRARHPKRPTLKRRIPGSDRTVILTIFPGPPQKPQNPRRRAHAHILYIRDRPGIS
jgi:hypothetical protein